MVFFCWWLSDYLDVFPIAIAFSYGGGEGCIESDFVDEAETCGADAETDPAVLFHIVELTAEEVYIEGALRATLGVGNVVSSHRSLSCDLTDSWHCLDVFWMVWLKLWGAGCAEEWNPLTGNACTLWLRNLGVVGTLSFLRIQRGFSNGSTLHGKWVLTSRAYPKRVQSYIFFEKRETFPSLFFHFFFIIRLLPRLTHSKKAQSHGRASPKNLFLPMTRTKDGRGFWTGVGTQKSLTQVWCHKKFFNYFLCL